MNDDTISRQAAIDALEKVAELYPWRVPGDRDSYSQYNEAWQDALNRADSEIEALPSAQPEIILCKECEYGKQDEYGRWYCRSFGCQVGDEDGSGFCSDAERKNNV